MASRKTILTGIGAALGVLMLGLSVLFVLLVYQQRDLIRNRLIAGSDEQQQASRRIQRRGGRTPGLPSISEEREEPIFAQPTVNMPVYVPRAPIRKPDPRPIRVGILHALSGPLSLNETVLKDVALATIEEINRRGGVLGRALTPVVMDTRSNWADFADKAAILLDREHVAVTFGCWDSTARRAVLNVFESRQALLFYPRYYEGEESSPSVFYAGGTPHQRAVPAARYLLSPDGGLFRRFVLFGSDDVYARTSHRIVRYFLRQQGIPHSDILEIYAPQDVQDFEPIVAKIRAFSAKGKAAVLSALEGDANQFFYTELLKQKLFAVQLPVLALALDATTISNLDYRPLVGQLVLSNYVMSTPTAENEHFVSILRQAQAALAKVHLGREGAQELPRLFVDETMVATYVGILLWAQAVEQAGTTQTSAVRQALAGQYLQSPSGVVEEMDRRDHHLHKPFFISRITFDGTFQPLYESKTAIAAEPFSRLVPETARKVADWTYPFMCSNCTQPRFPQVTGELASGASAATSWPLTR